MVSDHPSATKPDGDFCDTFRGQLFSISGQSKTVLPLSILPGGKAPLHPRCSHVLLPFDGSGLSDEELAERSQLPPEFIELGQRQASVNEYTRMWRERA